MSATAAQLYRAGDFTFTTIGGTYQTLMQMQTSLLSNGAPQPLTFELFKGAPGSGAAIAPSAGTSTAATLIKSISPGNYYLEFNTVSAPQELVTGGITLLSAAPEPAAWIMMLMGVAGLGAALRGRRRAAVVPSSIAS